MDGGAWQATAMGWQRVGKDQATSLSLSGYYEHKMS